MIVKYHRDNFAGAAHLWEIVTIVRSVVSQSLHRYPTDLSITYARDPQGRRSGSLSMEIWDTSRPRASAAQRALLRRLSNLLTVQGLQTRLVCSKVGEFFNALVIPYGQRTIKHDGLSPRPLTDALRRRDGSDGAPVSESQDESADVCGDLRARDRRVRRRDDHSSEDSGASEDGLSNADGTTTTTGAL